MNDKTYCERSLDNKCPQTKCIRNLNGFNGAFIWLSSDFVCSEELEDDNNDE